MIKKNLYILLVLSGIIPATLWVFGLFFLGLFFLSGATSHPEDFKNPKVVLFAIFIVLWFISGICGYLGLISLLKGLRKKHYIRNLILLSLGVLHNILFFTFVGESVWETTFDVEIIVAILPNLISLFFIIWIVIKMIKEKQEGKI